MSAKHVKQGLSLRVILLWSVRTRIGEVSVVTGVTQEGSWSRAMVVPG